MIRIISERAKCCRTSPSGTSEKTKTKNIQKIIEEEENANQKRSKKELESSPTALLRRRLNI